MSMIFSSLMFNQSKTQLMKGYDNYHHPLTAVKRTSQFTIGKGNFHLVLYTFAILIAVRKLIYPQQ